MWCAAVRERVVLVGVRVAWREMVARTFDSEERWRRSS